jgi:hypothetical protein
VFVRNAKIEISYREIATTTYTYTHIIKIDMCLKKNILARRSKIILLFGFLFIFKDNPREVIANFSEF